MQGKRMFKVVCPVEKPGGTWWMKVGTGFGNKDDSINIFIDALPLIGFGKNNEGIKLHIREYTEQEMRERAEKKASYQPRVAMDANGLPSMGPGRGASERSLEGDQPPPF